MKTNSVKSTVTKLKQSMFRLVFDHKLRQSLDLTNRATILFDQKEDLIGDMLVNTVAFRTIKQSYPEWSVQVLAGVTNREVIRTNPFVDKIHVFAGTLPTIRRLKREQLDIYYFHKNRLRFNDFVFLKHAGSKVNVGRNKAELKLFDYSINTGGETELDRYLGFLNFLGIEQAETRYDFPLTAEELSKARSCVSQLPGRLVIAFNRYGDKHGKLFNRTLAMRLVKEVNQVYPGATIVLLCPPKFRTETIDIRRRLGLSSVFVAEHTETIRDSAAIIHHADFVVTPDTSIVHIACAYNKPQICVYRDENELRLWRPLSEKAITLLPKPPSRHVNDLDVQEFKQSLVTIEEFLPAR